MAGLLQRQIDKVREAMHGRQPPAPPAQIDLFGPSPDEIRQQAEKEMRQFEADRRSWDEKLVRLQGDLEREPAKVRRLVYAPRGETAGWISWPSPRSARRGPADAGGLKLCLGRTRLFNDAANTRLPALCGPARRRPRSPTSSPGRCSARCTSCCAASTPPTRTHRGARARATRIISTRACSPS